MWYHPMTFLGWDQCPNTHKIRSIFYEIIDLSKHWFIVMSCKHHFIEMPESRSTLYIPALTLLFSSVFFDSFSITLLYSRRRGSWLWHSPVNTNTAVICVMGVSLNLTTPIKFSLTLINTDVHCILCKVYKSWF